MTQNRGTLPTFFRFQSTAAVALPGPRRRTGAILLLTGMLAASLVSGTGCSRDPEPVAGSSASPGPGVETALEEGLVSRSPYIRTVSEESTGQGVQRRFTICYNPLWTPDLSVSLDRLVFAQCGRYVEPVAERLAACTLLHPHAIDFSCLLAS